MIAYILNSCSTCQRILKDINWQGQVYNIKELGVPIELLEKIKDQEGNYLSAFSKRAMKYKSMGLKDKTLSEDYIKSLILDEYTFLKRPVIIISDQVFIGNSKSNVEAIKTKLESS